jgi:hypothetical protein
MSWLIDAIRRAAEQLRSEEQIRDLMRPVPDPDDLPAFPSEGVNVTELAEEPVADLPTFDPTTCTAFPGEWNTDRHQVNEFISSGRCYELMKEIVGEEMAKGMVVVSDPMSRHDQYVIRFKNAEETVCKIDVSNSPSDPWWPDIEEAFRASLLELRDKTDASGKSAEQPKLRVIRFSKKL